MDSVSGGLVGYGLLGSNGSDSNENFVVDCESVPQEGAENTLYSFVSIRVKWRVRIGRCRLLVFGAVGYGGMLVRR